MSIQKVSPIHLVFQQSPASILAMPCSSDVIVSKGRFGCLEVCLLTRQQYRTIATSHHPGLHGYLLHVHGDLLEVLEVQGVDHGHQ